MTLSVRSGANPAWFGYRVIETESLKNYCERNASDERVNCQRVHEPCRMINALPRNIADRDELPRDAGWWGYSFWDVPERMSGETLVADLPDCLIVPTIDEQRRFWVTILNSDNKSLEIREMALRRPHSKVLRTAQTDTIDEAVWMLERVYDNYSHWFTAHMPKLLLLREMGLSDKVLMPKERPSFIEDSLRLFGFDPSSFATFDPGRVMHVRKLTTLDTDRFRPDLLRRVHDACPRLSEGSARKRLVFISRTGAARRRLVNEEELWPMLEHRGFERVRMESLNFEEQVRLMQETAVLCAPHGAGLTNMLFCSPGTKIIEMADLSFPNPNFYAVASAMKHEYWLVPAEGVGDVRPLEKDLKVPRSAVEAVLDQALDQSLTIS